MGHAYRDREPVPQRSRGDLDSGHESAIRVQAESRFEGPECPELLHREEALRRENGVVGHRTVALREQEAVPVRGHGISWAYAEHAVVQHPEHVEGGRRARSVLLISRNQRQEARQVAVAERVPGLNLRSKHRMHAARYNFK